MTDNNCSQISRPLLELKEAKALFVSGLQEYVQNREAFPREQLKELCRKVIDKIKEIKKLFNVKIEEAREIMGENFFMGPEQVKKAFGVELDPKEIPKIPFSREQLEKAKSLNQFLVLRVGVAADGEPLTMKKMNGILEESFIRKNEGRILQDESVRDPQMEFVKYENKDFF